MDLKLSKEKQANPVLISKKLFSKWFLIKILILNWHKKIKAVILSLAHNREHITCQNTIIWERVYINLIYVVKINFLFDNKKKHFTKMFRGATGTRLYAYLSFFELTYIQESAFDW